MNSPLIEAENLGVTFFTPAGAVRAVREVSLQIHREEVLGLVGESGSGKSTVAFALMGYLPTTARVDGTVRFEGQEIIQMSPAELRQLRGNRIAMVYQDPASSLNPSMRIGPQVEEVLRQHLRISPAEARERAAELFESVGLADPRRIGRRYPHQLSGGMQQRVMIAMALACDPDLLIMDEPTTGLDVTTEATILDLVLDLRQRVKAGILFVSHNLGVIARVADRVAVMYAGQIVEQSPVRELFQAPRHPYTAGLISCVPRPPVHGGVMPRLRSIPGAVYSAQEPTLEACLFNPRCPLAQDRCREEMPGIFEAGAGHQSRCFFWKDVASNIWEDAEERELAYLSRPTEPVLTVQGLRRFYGRPRRKYVFFGPPQRPRVRALVDVGFQVQAGRTLGIVGESGSGKTTLARSVAGLISPTRGEIQLKDQKLAPRVEKRSADQRSAIRMVFQNPTASLNPKLPVRHAIIRSLRKFTRMDRREREEEAARLLEAVGLNPEYLDRLPGELSGGEQQRVALAGTFAGDVDLIIADEAVSALDVSVQAQVLNLLEQHQRETDTAYIFISHDLGVVRYVSDDILVLYAGHVAEFGPAVSVLNPPSHPYTEALLSAAPVPEPDAEPSHIRLEGAVPTLREAFQGCFFAGRCPRKIGAICDTTPPPARQGPDSKNHVIYCHIPVEELESLQCEGSRS